MSVTFKKILRKSPFDRTGNGKYYPHLITWGKPATLDTIAKLMKERSSLSLGDIKSVLSNFVEVMRAELYNGHAVNIENFGVFSLSASTVGTELKEDCVASNITSVRINFRASRSVRPQLNAERPEDRIDFVDVEQHMQEEETAEDGGEEEGGTEEDDNGGSPDPMV